MEKDKLDQLEMDIASRMKTWDERTDAEKMEYMRQAINQLEEASTFAYSRIEDLNNKIYTLQNHTHGMDGKAVISLERGMPSMGGGIVGALGKTRTKRMLD